MTVLPGVECHTMDSIRSQWDTVTHKWKEWNASMWGREPKDYHKMILDLNTPSAKDQTAIFKMRSTYMFSTLLGGVLSAATAFWATTQSASGWTRFRVPVSLGAGWIGATIGMRQASLLSRGLIDSVEDPSLKEVLKAYQADQLSARDELTLKRNVFDRLDAETIQKYESNKNEMTIRDKLDHLKHELERTAPKSESKTPTPPPSNQVPPDSTPPPKTVTHRQRLPEAIEAERRRSEANAKSTEPK